MTSWRRHLSLITGEDAVKVEIPDPFPSWEALARAIHEENEKARTAQDLRDAKKRTRVSRASCIFDQDAKPTGVSHKHWSERT